ncbi:hypothetical protein CRV24_008873 [Beauveria bassiana]|uniref:Uncharacterized protein n=1 Tax=Beauveria bassiana (strain ARSEF 2860) TaxID=655819 RepID=J5K031_BEAB2|nr:uncharacterized protein BBA_00787 [Beauveria bassiana ARSEF 2860]EJP69918.1 hypothetical protein BBA_00787 [Beauveria bassiana ARSEF 2860]KAF1730803.1 hypothetical protein CRV24_008873 [Beauveria bassiana]KAH8715156.1 hypothetical protein HC256_004008 [Beauveria bassiana]
MEPPRATARLLTSEEMRQGLDALDEEIGKSELLMSVAPIRLITVGGSLAVLLCGNRTSSTDIDCILDPQVAEDSDYAEEWSKVVATAADAVHLEDDWLNDQLGIFVRRDKRKMLFLESVQQDIAIYEGKNVVIYAGRLDWALERKIRRVAYATERRQVKNVDTTDAAAIIKLMVSRVDYPTPLSFEFIRGLNYNGFDVAPTDEAIREVARYYKETYGDDGIIEQ